MLNRPALILLLVAVAASSASARQTIRTQDVDVDSDSPFANVFLQMHSSVRAASLDRAFTAVKDCDVPSDKNSAPCCSGIQCPFKGGMCCPGTKTCCPGGTSCMEAIEGVPQQCQSLAFLGEAADTLDAKVKYLKAASAEKARRTQIILDQVALMTTGGLNQAPPVPQPRCTGAQPCLAADLLAPNSFPASQLTNADGSSLSAAQAAALQAQQAQAPVDPNPYVPRQPSPEQKDMTCVCPPVAPCGSNYCAPPPKCACDLFWSSHLQHQGRIALDDQEPGDENYNTSPQNSTSSEDLANAIARAAAEAEEKAEAERQAQLQAAEQDAELLKKLFDENDNSSMSAAHSLAVQEAKHVSESIKILDDITAMDVPELAPALNLTKGPPLKTVDNTMSFMDPNNDPLVLKAQNRGGENVANRAIDDVDDRRDDGPPQAGDDDVFEPSDTVSKELQRDASSSARHQQTNIVVNLQMSRNGTGGGYFSHRPKIPANEPEESSSEPEAKDAAEAREEKFSKKEEKKQEMLARKLLNRRKLETRTEYCVSRSPAAKGPLRTLMFSNDPTCGAEHAPAFEQYARFYAFPFPVAGSAAYCVATTRDSMWRMQVVVDDTSCVTKSWNQEFVFYAYPTYHPGTAPFCIKESTNGNSVKRQYIDPGRTACSSEYWKQIGVFYAFQTPGDPSAVPSPADLKADDENSEETSEESTAPKVTAGAGAGSQVTPVRFASAPPMPPSAQPRFVQRTQRMPVAPPTPGSYDAPKLSLREKAARDEKNWKDLMNNMGPRATNQQPLAPWANRR